MRLSSKSRALVAFCCTAAIAILCSKPSLGGSPGKSSQQVIVITIVITVVIVTVIVVLIIMIIVRSGIISGSLGEAREVAPALLCKTLATAFESKAALLLRESPGHDGKRAVVSLLEGTIDYIRVVVKLWSPFGSSK